MSNDNDGHMVVPAEYAATVKKLFPKETTLGLVKILKKGISRVEAERRFAKKPKDGDGHVVTKAKS